LRKLGGQVKMWNEIKDKNMPREQKKLNLYWLHLIKEHTA